MYICELVEKSYKHHIKMNFDNLRKTCEERLDQLMLETDQLNKAFLQIEKAKAVLNKINISLDIVGYENLLRYRLFLGIVAMDLCSSILIHVKSNSNYENIFSARQIIVIITEAYKKIYNFIPENKYGDILTKYRNNSYWIKEIGFIIENEIPLLKSEFNEITLDLDEYLKINFDDLQIQRNLSVHYDKDPLKVYKMLTELNVDETFQLLIPFMNIINKMFVFTDKVKEAFQFESNKKADQLDQNFENMAFDLDKFKKGDNNEFINEIQTVIMGMKNT